MKKYFLLLVLMFCWNLYSAWGYDVVRGYDVEVDGIYYNLNNSDMTASVSYYQKEVYGIDELFYSPYKGDIVIPTAISVDSTIYSVTSIGADSFHSCSKLTSITIPESVTSLGWSCFCNCSNLTSITIPNSVTSLVGNCFYGCSKLTSITIPNSVTSLGMYCFEKCSSLTSITIPNSVTSLGKWCFCNCSSLTSITIPNSVTSLEECCFYGCSNLTSITIPNTVTSLGNHCFQKCSRLNFITIPPAVTSLGSYCFSGCSSLTYIALLPISLSEVDESVFSDTPLLKRVYVANDNAKAIYQAKSPWNNYNIVSITNSAPLICRFDSLQHTATVIGYDRITNSISIPESITADGELYSVTSLAVGCFYDCTDLSSIAIPSSVISVGKSCFKGCTGLTSITLPNSAMYLGDKCFANCI